MRRRLLPLLTGTLLVLFAVTLGLWIKSFWKGNGIGHMAYFPEGDGSVRRVIYDSEIIRGAFIFGREQVRIDTPDPIRAAREMTHGLYIYSPQPRYSYIGRLVERNLMNRLGFFIMDDPGATNAMLMRLVVPGWFVLLILAAPAAYLLRLVLWRRRRMLRLKRGQCMHCGYDLRASKERCPECGMAIPAKVF